MEVRLDFRGVVYAGCLAFGVVGFVAAEGPLESWLRGIAVPAFFLLPIFYAPLMALLIGLLIGVVAFALNASIMFRIFRIGLISRAISALIGTLLFAARAIWWWAGNVIDDGELTWVKVVYYLSVTVLPAWLFYCLPPGQSREVSGHERGLLEPGRRGAHLTSLYSRKVMLVTLGGVEGIVVAVVLFLVSPAPFGQGAMPGYGATIAVILIIAGAVLGAGVGIYLTLAGACGRVLSFLSSGKIPQQWSMLTGYALGILCLSALVYSVFPDSYSWSVVAALSVGNVVFVSVLMHYRRRSATDHEGVTPD